VLLLCGCCSLSSRPDPSHLQHVVVLALWHHIPGVVNEQRPGQVVAPGQHREVLDARARQVLPRPDVHLLPPVRRNAQRCHLLPERLHQALVTRGVSGAEKADAHVLPLRERGQQRYGAPAQLVAHRAALERVAAGELGVQRVTNDCAIDVHDDLVHVGLR
jgi:hypothetical protein